MKSRALPIALLAVILLAACSAFRSPRLFAPLSYQPVATAPDESFRAFPPPDGPLTFTPSVRLQMSKLASGVALVLVERHDLPLFSATLVTSRGARDIGQRTEMVDLAASVVRRAHELSGQANPEFRPELQCHADGCEASTAGLSRSLPAALKVLGDLALRPSFPETQLPMVRRDWKTYVESMGGTSTSAVSHNTRALLFPAEDAYSVISPEGRRAIDGVSLRDLAAAYTQIFQPEHTTLIVAGDVTLTKLQELAHAEFGTWTQSRRIAQSAVVSPHPVATARTMLVNQVGTLVHAYIVARGPLPTDPALDGLSLLGAVLGTPKGALEEEIRSSMNATYGIQALVRMGRGGSWFMIGGAFEIDKAPEAVKALLVAVRNARDQGVGAADLEGARTRLVAGLREEAGTTAGLTSLIADSLVNGRTASDVLARPGRIAKLTMADLQNAAKTYLADNALRLIVVGPARSIDGRFAELGIGSVEWRTWRGERP